MLSQTFSGPIYVFENIILWWENSGNIALFFALYSGFILLFCLNTMLLPYKFLLQIYKLLKNEPLAIFLVLKNHANCFLIFHYHSSLIQATHLLVCGRFTIKSKRLMKAIYLFHNDMSIWAP